MTSSKNGGIIRSILIQGDGGSSPNDGATVESKTIVLFYVLIYH